MHNEVKARPKHVTSFPTGLPNAPNRLNDVSCRFMRKVERKHPKGTDLTGKSVFSHLVNRDPRESLDGISKPVLSEAQQVVSYFGYTNPDTYMNTLPPPKKKPSA